MKKDWTYKKLVDVCGIQYGYPFDSKCFTEDNTYPALIRIRDVVRGYTETFYKGVVPEEYYVQKGEYLIGMDGEFNIAPWRSEKALLNQRVCKIFSITSNVDIQFVYYSLQRQLKQIEDETPFVTVKHLSAKRLNQIELPIPPLSIQRSIVAELDLLHSVISKKKDQLRELDNLAQSLFYQMFGDPITNPMGWEVKKLGEVCGIINGKNQKSVENPNGEYVICGSGGIMGRANDYICPENTVIIGRKGNINRPILMREKYWNVDTAFGLVPNTDSLLVDYLYIFTQEYDFEQLNVAVTIPSLRKTDIAEISIPLPPLSLQQSFAAKVSAIEAQKQAITQSIQHTEALLAQRMDNYFGI